MVSESRLAYTSTLELPSKVCESFYRTKNGEDKQEDGSEEEIFYVDIEDVENSESRNNDRSDTLNGVLSESQSSSGSSNKESSDSDSDSVSSYSSSESIEPEPEPDSNSDFVNSEITQNQITNNDLTNSESENIAETDNSNEVNSESDTSSGTENSEGTHNKITIQNYGYESEAVLKSAACPELYDSFKILLLSTLFTKACC